MSVAKVTLNGSVIVDMTDATASAPDITSPKTAYIANGSKVTGTGSGSGGITPTGNINITQAGTTDVTNYATAYVPELEYTAHNSITYRTANNQRKCDIDAWSTIDTAGFAGVGTIVAMEDVLNAVPANTTITPTTSAQTIGGANYMMEGAVTVAAMPSGTAGTPTATKGTVSNHSVTITPSVTNTTGYITGGTKTGTGITVTASELASGNKAITQNGTNIDVVGYSTVSVNVSGGGSSSGSGGTAQVATATTTLASANASISFTGLSGEPTSFAVCSSAELTTGASPWKTAAVVYDGTNHHGQTIRNTSNAQVTYDGSAFSHTYSNGTLTVTGTGTNFQANAYTLVYTYGTTTIETKEVQVGSGATNITFTGLTNEPSYFSCIFKSNFNTSSGYQRVIAVVYDGTSTYGMEMDSSAKYSNTHWSYTYNNGSLTITSSGTNAGGYFHQPGNYQLTAATGGSGNGDSNTDNAFLITLLYETATEKFIPDKTHAEILAAYQAGKTLTFEFPSEYFTDAAEMAVNGYYDSSNDNLYYAVGIKNAENSTYKIKAFMMGSDDNAVPYNTYEFHTTYQATISSNNQLLNGIKAVGSDGVVYTGSIQTRTSSDVTASGATVTIPTGYYASQVTKSVTNGTAGTPTATKGTVSNNQITITPSVQNTTGYITGGTKTGTAITVSASELATDADLIAY